MSRLLLWLTWGVSIVALLNIAAMVSLIAAYAWHHGLKPKLARRRSRQQWFERRLAQCDPPNLSTDPESSTGDW